MYSQPGIFTPSTLPNLSRLPPPPPRGPTARPKTDHSPSGMGNFRETSSIDAVGATACSGHPPAQVDPSANPTRIPARNQPVSGANTTVTTVTPEGVEPVTVSSELTEMELFRRLIDDRFQAVHAKIHSGTSLAPEIDRLVAETGRTLFASNISKVKIGDAGKVRLPKYSGTTNPKFHMTVFRIGIGRAHLYKPKLQAGYY